MRNIILKCPFYYNILFYSFFVDKNVHSKKNNWACKRFSRMWQALLKMGIIIILKGTWNKSVLWEYSCDEKYLEEINKRKNLKYSLQAVLPRKWLDPTVATCSKSSKKIFLNHGYPNLAIIIEIAKPTSRKSPRRAFIIIFTTFKTPDCLFLSLW